MIENPLYQAKKIIYVINNYKQIYHFITINNALYQIIIYV